MEVEKVVVGVLCLSLMSGEADFDEAKGEVEARWQIYLGGQGQGQGHCRDASPSVLRGHGLQRVCFVVTIV